MTNINELLSKHVTLEVECLDRLYLNGYIPHLQVGGQLASFLVHHRGQPIPSPALLGKMTAALSGRITARATVGKGLTVSAFPRYVPV